MNADRAGTRPEELDEAYFFNEPRSLFACFHPPRPESPPRAPGCGVVLCYPLGPEYVRSHRAYRQLALRLSRAGYPVLRFDLYGTGDSAGDSVDGHLGRWLGDVADAVREVAVKGAVDRVCLVGLRLGGTLALLAGGVQPRVQGIALWDPVIDGRAYVEELEELNRQPRWGVSDEAPREVPADREAGSPTELLGMRLSSAALAELQAVDLLDAPVGPGRDVLVLHSETSAAGQDLAARLREGSHVTAGTIPSTEIWRSDEQALVPLHMLRAIVDWVVETFP